MSLKFARCEPLITELDALAPTPGTESAFEQFGVGVFATHWQYSHVRTFCPAVGLVLVRGNVDLMLLQVQLVLRLVRAVLNHDVSRLKLAVPSQRVGVFIRPRLADKTVVHAEHLLELSGI